MKRKCTGGCVVEVDFDFTRGQMRLRCSWNGWMDVEGKKEGGGEGRRGGGEVQAG